MEGKIDKFSKHIRNFEVSHYVWIYENEDKAIYESVHSHKKIARAHKYNKQIARVIATKKVNNTTYYYLEINGNEIGWSDLKSSNVIYSKPREHVKVDVDLYNNKRSEQLQPLDKKSLGQLRNQMLDARFIMIRRGVQYEALFRGVHMVGWFTSEVLHRSQRANIPVSSYSSKIKLYNFNNLTSRVRVDDDKMKPIKIIHVFKSLGLIKVRTGMGDYWTELKYIEDDLSGALIDNSTDALEDIVVYDLIQNISEERKMTINLVDKLRNQYGMSGEGLNARPGGLEGEIELLENELEEERSKRENIETKYNNLRKSLLGKLQTKYWEKRSRR